MAQEIVGSGWSFPPKIGSQGGFALTREVSEIDQSILIILSTTPGERVMRPTFGSRLSEFIFEPANERTLAQVEEVVHEALAMWEPRIDVDRVTTMLDPTALNRILIDIEYIVKDTSDVRSLVYPFYSIPGE